MGMDRLPGLSLALNTGRPPYPGERARLSIGYNNDLIAPGGIPDLISVEYKSKDQKDLQQHLKESLDQKLTLKIPALLNSLQQKGIPETIKLGNKNNNQDPSPPSAPQIGTP